MRNLLWWMEENQNPQQLVNQQKSSHFKKITNNIFFLAWPIFHMPRIFIQWPTAIYCRKFQYPYVETWINLKTLLKPYFNWYFNRTFRIQIFWLIFVTNACRNVRNPDQYFLTLCEKTWFLYYLFNTAELPRHFVLVNNACTWYTHTWTQNWKYPNYTRHQ